MFLRRRFTRTTSRGQAMVEFALVLPILVLIVLGIMQFGLLFWSQITLTQVARDTGRWAATQNVECATPAVAASVVSQARAIADKSQLYGYGGGADPDLTITPTWSGATPCPPINNASAAWVEVAMTYSVDTFMPFISETCTPTCRRILTTEVQFRMEPEPAP